MSLKNIEIKVRKGWIFMRKKCFAPPFLVFMISIKSFFDPLCAYSPRKCIHNQSPGKYSICFSGQKVFSEPIFFMKA